MKQKNMHITLFVLMMLLASWMGVAQAHFLVLVPSTDYIGEDQSNQLEFEMIFTHPADGSPVMEMEKPIEFGVFSKGRKTVLTDTLKKMQVDGATAWQANYAARGMGDFVFYLIPQPYYEAMEDGYITQHTKVVVNSAGLPTDWDTELGLEAEIVPLSKPYGLFVGNVFQGVVMYQGEVVPYAEIEIERLNSDGWNHYPTDPHVTQVVKADSQGVFTYGIPKSGWWGFAALLEGEDFNGKGHEVGAVLWIKAYDLE